MKSVVIITRQFIMGGVEKALISMLELLPKEEYEVTVLVMENGGELFESIPKHINVNCIYGNENRTYKGFLNYIGHGQFINAIKFGFFSMLARQAKSAFEQQIIHSKMLPKIKYEFDLAIAFHIPASFPVIYGINNIKAKKKVAWIHNDVSEPNYRITVPQYEYFYENYDKVFCVSQNARDNFDEMFPKLKEKTFVFYNILDSKKIVSMSREKESFSDQFNGTRILTIGRLSTSKGQDIIPLVISKLITYGFNNIRWYCIGEGEKRRELEKLIKEHRLENHLFLLGGKNNPYPYIKDCNLYVQPSRHEGYCITLAEARALHKPIITTNTVGAREQIVNGRDGIIVDFDADQIAASIISLVNETKIRDNLIENLTNKNVSTVLEINKLFDLLS